MNKNTAVVLGIIALVVIAGGIYVSTHKKEEVVMTDEQKDKAIVEAKDQTAMGQDIIKDNAMLKAGSYESYSPEKIAKAATGNVVLFFRASWCPTCISLNKDIKANLNKIPASLTILDVDYDNSFDLKKKYGVTFQHTFVQVDKDGNLIKKWSGSPTLTALISEIK